MKITTILVAALSLAFLAACDRGQPRPATSGASGSSAAPAPQTQTPPSSANAGKTERNPVQGQVDPKEGAQHKDFQTNK
jgi:uncharacterized lipoprotein